MQLQSKQTFSFQSLPDLYGDLNGFLDNFPADKLETFKQSNFFGTSDRPCDRFFMYSSLRWSHEISIPLHYTVIVQDEHVEAKSQGMYVNRCTHSFGLGFAQQFLAVFLRCGGSDRKKM